MAKQNYGHAGRIGDVSNRIIIRTDRLKNVKAAFSSNFERIAALWLFPINTALFAQELAVASRFAEKDILGEYFPPQDECEKRRDDIESRATQLVRERVANPDGKELLRQAIMFTNIDTFIELGGEETVEGETAIFNSMVVQAWTAFEVMAGDLWEQALNEHPNVLCKLNGKKWNLSRTTGGDDESLRKPTDDDAKGQVRISYLERFGFDLSNAMGSALRSKYNFTVLESTRQAYAEAFAIRSDEIKAALLNKCLDHLSAVRNVIVHRAAIADKKFLNEVGGSGLFSGTNPGDPVILTGVAASQLIRPVFQRSIDLIAAVDDWIFKSPDRHDGTPRDSDS